MYDAQYKTDLQPNGSKAYSVELWELSYELKLCRFCLDRNEKAGEGRIKRTKHERKKWVGVWKHDGRGQRKRCQTVAQGDMRAEMRKIQLKHCFPGLERPKQLNTEDRLNQLQGLCQGCMCCDGGCGGFRHLAELRLNEQSSYNTREVQTAKTLARTWKDQPFLHIRV